jgi:hypothetical protein
MRERANVFLTDHTECPEDGIGCSFRNVGFLRISGSGQSIKESERSCKYCSVYDIKHVYHIFHIVENWLRANRIEFMTCALKA